MRTTRKPDLLVVLVVFVALAFIVSSYIQYLAYPADEEHEPHSNNHDVVSTYKPTDNQIVTVSESAPSFLSANGDSVNNSLP